MDEIEGEHPEALTAYIYVREPKFLSLTVKPYRNWALMIGQQYEVSVDVYDSDNMKIFIANVGNYQLRCKLLQSQWSISVTYLFNFCILEYVYSYDI